MPTYEYLCGACHHEWEAFQSIKADPLSTCPACGANAAQRQVSLGGGFILKGSGWYSDLYSSPRPGAPARADQADGGGSADKGKDAGSADKGKDAGAAASGNGKPDTPAVAPAEKSASDRPAPRPSAPPAADKP